MPRVVGNKTMLVCLKTRKKLLKVQSAPCFLSAKTVRRVRFLSFPDFRIVSNYYVALERHGKSLPIARVID